VANALVGLAAVPLGGDLGLMLADSFGLVRDSALDVDSQLLLALREFTLLLEEVGLLGDGGGYESIGTFLRNLSTIVIDEVHAYSGVFGSNAAFMYRRLQHAMAVLGGSARFVAASATMKNPAEHLEKLMGRKFTVVGPERDTSPRHAVEILMVRPPEDQDHHSAMSALLMHLRDGADRFIAFFDSRKSAEQMSSILHREECEDGDTGFDHLLHGQVLPYRAGYEPEHRELIQRRLNDGSLRGVLSTSALELGMDIPGLSLAVLVGVPGSTTSMHQRIGRIGRSGPGRVLVVHSGSVYDDVVFNEPETLFSRPMKESAVYLGSQRVQYIHAMALARQGGEHDGAHAAASRPAAPLGTTGVEWPEGFLTLCEDERQGRVPHNLRDMKREAGEQPTLCFLLRDVESQFDVSLRRGMHRDRLGSLSWSQVMREAYPGAVYYYTGRPYRVIHVDLRSRQVHVSPSPRYSTQAVPVHSRISPQRVVHRAEQRGELTLAECDVQIWRAVLGFRERRGSVVDQVSYPCHTPVRWNASNFSRSFFTTGVCIAHPALDADGVDTRILASLLHEAFLMVVPLDRQDVDASDDGLRASWGPLERGRRFLVVYDQAYGSLRLSGRLLDDEVLPKVLEVVAGLAAQRQRVTIGLDEIEMNDETRRAALALHDAVGAPIARPTFSVVGDDERVRVLLPRSRGVASTRPDESFEVHQVFVRPDMGVCYRGVWIGASGARTPGVVPVDQIAPGPDPIWGFYDVETGEQVAA
jgi:DEAD/DEAH box helicase domain-containing protein